jgi:hypothetical protein
LQTDKDIKISIKSVLNIQYRDLTNGDIMLDIKDLVKIKIDRLSTKFDKEYLDCADIMKITGLGRDVVRDIMRKKDFPTSNFGRRKLVSLISFAVWQANNEWGEIYERVQK